MIDRQNILSKFSFSPFAPNFAETDLLLLRRYAQGATFVVETGTGISTHYVADGAQDTCALMYSIDIRLPPEAARVSWVQYTKGWSMTAADLPRSNTPDFLKSKYVSPEDPVVFKGVTKLKGDDDILRGILEANRPLLPDFVFSDGGEYSGYPEWLLVNYPRLKPWACALSALRAPRTIGWLTAAFADVRWTRRISVAVTA